MTKLEEEIARSLPFAHSFDYSKGANDFQEVPDEYLAQVARAAAEVAKKYIEKALDYNVLLKTFDATPQEIKSKWLKENGIIENQPTDKAPGPLQEPAGDNIKPIKTEI